MLENDPISDLREALEWTQSNLMLVLRGAPARALDENVSFNESVLKKTEGLVILDGVVHELAADDTVATGRCVCRACGWVDDGTLAGVTYRFQRAHLESSPTVHVVWGVYSYDDGTWYKSEPPGYASALANWEKLRKTGENCEVFDERLGRKMERVYAAARCAQGLERGV